MHSIFNNLVHWWFHTTICSASRNTIMNNTLLITAGIIGVSVSVFHGVLLQKLMIKPLMQSSYGQALPVQTRRLIPLLLHFSTLFWFLGGVCLIVAPYFFSDTERFVISVAVGSLYAFGAVGNLWGTKGKHPGWILLTISVALIFFSFH